MDHPRRVDGAALSGLAVSSTTSNQTFFLRPGSPFVAELTGAELLLHGRVESLDDGLAAVRVSAGVVLWAAVQPGQALRMPQPGQQRHRAALREAHQHDAAGRDAALDCDAAPSEGLGGRAYRLRARLKPGESMAAAAIDAVWLNAVWSMHYQRIERETGKPVISTTQASIWAALRAVGGWLRAHDAPVGGERRGRHPPLGRHFTPPASRAADAQLDGNGERSGAAQLDAVTLQLAPKLCFGRQVTCGYGGIVGRAENQEMVRILKLNVSHVRHLQLKKFDRFALVDTQPGTGNNQLPSGVVPDVVCPAGDALDAT